MTLRDDTPMIDQEHPWPWLDAFPESARSFFNGRDEAAQQLLRCVLAAPATVLFGKSGLGKTSLLQAGLSPLLREEQLLPVLVRLTHQDAVYQSGLLSSRLLARLDEEVRTHGLRRDGPLLLNDAVSTPPTVIGASTRLWELLHDTEACWLDAQGEEWTPVFILDQFEEVFTLVHDPEQQQRLFSELGNLIQNRTPSEVAERRKAHEPLRLRLDPERLGARFVLSLREDYLPDLEIHADRIPRLGPNRYRLLPMSQADALQAIDTTGGALVDTADAKGIVQFLDQQNQQPADTGRPRAQRRERIEPALLSLVCAGLNQHRIDQKASKLDTRSLDQLGGQLLEHFYDRALAVLPQPRREAAARFVETELITLDGTRRPFPEVSLARVGLTTDDVATLKDNRLLRTENTEHGAFVELVHDRLAVVALQRARRNAELAAEAEEAQQRQRKRDLLLGIGSLLFAVALLGAIAFFWQWRKTDAALARAELAVRDATAQRVLSDANDFFSGVNRPSTGPQNLLMTLAGHRIAQQSVQPFVQNAGYAALQREFQRSGSWVWLQEVGATVACIAISPDGSRIVSGSWDSTLRLWDARSGAPIGQPLQGHSRLVSSVAFSPDGSRIVSGSWDSTLRLWDARSGVPIGQPLRGHSNFVESVAFSPDGLRVVSGSADKTLQLWDARAGTPIGLPLKGHSDSISSVAFSPNGSRIVSGSRDGTLQLWNARTGAPIGQSLRGHLAAVTSAAFSPDGSRIVSGSWDSTLRLWDARSGATIGQPLNGHSKAVLSVAFSPDGSRVVSGSMDRTLQLWDARASATIGQPLSGHSDSISSVAFSPDGSLIVSGSSDGTLRRWDLQSLDPVTRHSDAVNSVGISPDGSRIVSGSWDGTLRLWDSRSGVAIGQPLRGHSGAVYSVAYSPDGSRIASAGEDMSLRLWNARNGTPAGRPMQGHTDAITSIAFSPDGSLVITGSMDRSLGLWDGYSGAPLGQLRRALSEAIWSVAISPDGSRIVDSDLQLWDVRARLPIGQPMLAETDSAVLSVAFSPDGLRIVSGDEAGGLSLWDASSGTRVDLPRMGHPSQITSVAFSADGLRIVSASSDGTVRLWDARSGAPIGRPLQTDSTAIWTVKFGPDGSRVVSGNGKGILRIWPVFEGWAELLCSKLPRNMSHDEWRNWVSPDIDYVQQCPGKPIPVGRAEARATPAVQASGNFD